MPYTYSKFYQYNSCPRLYKYTYIDKIKVDNKECFIKGNNIHNILYNYKQDLPTNNDIVDNFFNSDIGSGVKNVLLNTCTKREHKIALTKDFKTCNYESSECFFRGIVDLLYYDKNTNLLNLIDYKTGKYKNFQDYNQLLAYSLYFFNSSFVEKIKIRFIYVEHNKENSLIVNSDNTKNIKSYITDTASKIENDIEYNRNPSWRCAYCQYSTICNSQMCS